MTSSLLRFIVLTSSFQPVWAAALPPLLPLLSRGDDDTLLANKPSVIPPFPEATQNQDLLRDLHAVDVGYEFWDPDWLPSACVFEANELGFNVTDFQAAEVWYDDCAASWTFCRHKEAVQSWDELLEVSRLHLSNKAQTDTLQLLSRIPVGLRQYISNFILLPPYTNSLSTKPPMLSAYTRASTIVSSHTHLNLGVLLHEIAHILDTHCPTLQARVIRSGLPPGKTPFSSTPIWQRIVTKDAALPTPYARVSWQESFADAVRWGVSYMVKGEGRFGRYSPTGWRGCLGQMRAIERWLERVVWPRGLRCWGRVEGSKGIRIVNAEGNGTEGERKFGRTGPESLQGTGVRRIKLATGEEGVALAYVYGGGACRVLRECGIQV